MYRGWHVCSQRTTCTCDSGRLRTSCSKGLYPLYWSHSNCPLGFNSPKCSVIHFYKHYVSLCVCCAKCGTWFLANYLNITYFAYQYTSVEVHPFVDIPQWKYIHLLMYLSGSTSICWYTSVEVHPFVDIPQWKYIHLLIYLSGSTSICWCEGLVRWLATYSL